MNNYPVFNALRDKELIELMRRIFFVFFVASFSLILVQCTSDEKVLQKKLNEIATNLNESVPVMLDQFTRFDGASVEAGNIFRYSYTVLNTENPDSLVGSALQSLKENIGAEFASNPDLLIFKKNNVTIEYVYNNETGTVIRSLLITPEDYQ